MRRAQRVIAPLLHWRRTQSTDAADLHRTLLEAISAGDVESAQQLAAAMARKRVAPSGSALVRPPTSAPNSDVPSTPVAPQAASINATVQLVGTSFVDVWAGVAESEEESADAACQRLLNFFQLMLQEAVDAQFAAVSTIVSDVLRSFIASRSLTARVEPAAASAGRHRQETMGNLAVRVNPLLHQPNCSVVEFERLVKETLVGLYDDAQQVVKARLSRPHTRRRDPPLTPETKDAAIRIAHFLDEHVFVGALSPEMRTKLTHDARVIAERAVAALASTQDPTAVSSRRAMSQAMLEAKTALLMEEVTKNRIALASGDTQGSSHDIICPAVLRYDVGLHDDVTEQLCHVAGVDSSVAASMTSSMAAELIAELNRRAVVGLNRQGDCTSPVETPPACSGPMTESVLRHRHVTKEDLARSVNVARPLLPFGVLLTYRVQLRAGG